MCRLFAYNGRKRNITWRLRTFYKGSFIHSHGWGLMVKEKFFTKVWKEPRMASKSPYLKYILDSQVKTSLAIAHIRLASRGVIAFENTHPYSRDIAGKRWTLAHNGTLDVESIPDSPLYAPYGRTDSEKLFCLLAGTIHETDCDIQAIESVIEELSPLGTLNLLFTDRERLFAYHNGGTLYLRHEDGGIFISTVPLCRKKWKPFPKGRLIIFQDGEQIYRSPRMLHDYSEQLYFSFSFLGTYETEPFESIDRSEDASYIEEWRNRYRAWERMKEGSICRKTTAKK